jgi:hypothetical protein
MNVEIAEDGVGVDSVSKKRKLLLPKPELLENNKALFFMRGVDKAGRGQEELNSDFFVFLCNFCITEDGIAIGNGQLPYRAFHELKTDVATVNNILKLLEHFHVCGKGGASFQKLRAEKLFSYFWEKCLIEETYVDIVDKAIQPMASIVRHHGRSAFEQYEFCVNAILDSIDDPFLLARWLAQAAFYVILQRGFLRTVSLESSGDMEGDLDEHLDNLKTSCFMFHGRMKHKFKKMFCKKLVAFCETV